MPDPGAAVDYNRFLYVRGNPLKYTDPSGHCIPEECPNITPADYPGNWSLEDGNYIGYLLKVVAWRTYDQEVTGGVLSTEFSKKATLKQLQAALMHEADPETLMTVALEEALGATPEMAASAINGVSGIGALSTAGLGSIIGRLSRGSKSEYGPFHRRASETQTAEIAKMQESSGEIWGATPRGGIKPTVQAWNGPLPNGVQGIEFYTNVAPDSGTPRHRANWSGPRPGVRVENGYAKICCTVTKNTQR